MRLSLRGLVPDRVYQRDETGRADFPFEGEVSEGDGAIETRVLCGESVIRDWERSGAVSDGRFTGVIRRIPTGGEYTLQLRFPSGQMHAVQGVLVGDLWILAGQSNMVGRGKLIGLERPHRMVHCFSLQERWLVAKDPLFQENESLDSAYWRVPPEKREDAARQDRLFGAVGATLGVRFGKEVYRHTGIPVGLVLSAKGGSSMAQWDPKLKHLGGDSLYGSLLRRVEAVGGKVAGCLWYQGEQETEITALRRPPLRSDSRSGFAQFAGIWHALSFQSCMSRLERFADRSRARAGIMCRISNFKLSASFRAFIWPRRRISSYATRFTCPRNRSRSLGSDLPTWRGCRSMAKRNSAPDPGQWNSPSPRIERAFALNIRE